MTRMKRIVFACLLALFCSGCFLDSLWSDDDDDAKPENPEKIYRHLTREDLRQ